MHYYVFRGRVTLFFANNSLTYCRITMVFIHNFLDPEVIFISHTLFINAYVLYSQGFGLYKQKSIFQWSS